MQPWFEVAGHSLASCLTLVDKPEWVPFPASVDFAVESRPRRVGRVTQCFEDPGPQLGENIMPSNSPKPVFRIREIRFLTMHDTGKKAARGRWNPLGYPMGRV